MIRTLATIAMTVALLGTGFWAGRQVNTSHIEAVSYSDDAGFQSMLKDTAARMSQLPVRSVR